MTKTIAVVNNKRGRAADASIKHVIGRLKKNAGADIALTEHPGHAEKLVKESPEYGIIVAVGGDGTVSEVINGMNLETQKLSVMPRGRGNSFARDLGITSVKKAFEALERKDISKTDLINCRFQTQSGTRERYGIATTGFGFASDTVIFANRYLAAAGPFCYSLSACFSPFSQRLFSARIKVDNLEPESIAFTNFFVNNTRHSGNTCVFPKADLRDAVFHMLFARTNVVTQCLWNLSVITKTYFYYPGVRLASRLHMKLDRPSSFMLDGEIFDHVQEIEYSVTPNRLEVLV